MHLARQKRGSMADSEFDKCEAIGNQFGYLCPTCNEGSGLHIAVDSWARIYLDGTETGGDTQWDGNSAATCECGWSGKVHQFKIAEGFKEDDLAGVQS